MRIRIPSFLLLLLSSSLAIAQVPQGHYHLAFTNPPVWDISGNYDRIEGLSTIASTLSVQPNGKLIGTRTESYTNGTDFIIGPSLIGGRIISRPGQVGFLDQWKGESFGKLGGAPIRAKVSNNGKGIVVPATLSLQSTGKYKFCMVGEKCTTSDLVTELPIPQPMDGTWAIDMDITASGNKLVGQATLVLSNNRSFAYEVTGAYNSSMTKGVLRLKGTGDASKTRITLTTMGADLQVTKVGGKLLGQNLKWP